ncbi:hypothetical protein [Massilia psychrophila]|uniref:hypothetical protein n=1 Tax=Massilia psychrophila TaxID=1603353 RepID=UPI001C557B5F|nr:hypothetical protein [Massilia psychrophila]
MSAPNCSDAGPTCCPDDFRDCRPKNVLDYNDEKRIAAMVSRSRLHPSFSFYLFLSLLPGTAWMPRT